MERFADMQCRERARTLGCVVVIPTYNNAATLSGVIQGVSEYVGDIIVVNDGSTDATAAILEGLAGIEVISYEKNRGKGHALKTGLRTAAERGFRYAITIDSDGQHYPENIADFIDCAQWSPDSMVVGARNLEQENMPAKNTFANRFSNFWFRLETGRKLSDTQSGYRLYPLHRIRKMRFVTTRYEFELEALVRLAWKGVEVIEVPIRVWYAPEGDRISHFRPLQDFTRISILNTGLVLVALTVYYPYRFFRWISWKNFKELVRNNLTHTSESNLRIALAVSWGVFWGIAPVWGYQMVLAGVTAHLLKLNKVIAVLASNISIPPMIPFILYGSYVAGAVVMGRPLTMPFSDISLDVVGTMLLQYVVGSMVLAVTAAMVGGLIMYPLLAISRKKQRNG